MQPNVSVFANVSPASFKGHFTVDQVMKNIRSTKYRAQTDHLRTITDTEVARIYKAGKPDEQGKLEVAGHFYGVTWSGCFEGGKKTQHLQQHSGLICMDMDGLTPDKLATLSAQLRADEYTHLLFISPSGSGLKWVVRTELQHPDEHKAYFCQLADYLHGSYGLTRKGDIPKGEKPQIDPQCKNVDRLCFLPCDPDAYQNSESATIPLLPEYRTDPSVKADQPTQAPDTSENAEYMPQEVIIEDATRRRINDCISQLHRLNIDLTIHYDDWIQVGLAFASIGEQGRIYFHEVSRQNTGYTYSECDTKFTELLRNRKGSVNIGSFFHRCQEVLEPLTSRQEQPKEKTGSNTQNDKSRVQSDLLTGLLEREHQLRQIASRDIIFSPPLISRQDIGIVRRGTINVIQGAYGSHKSRAAELILSLILKKTACPTDFLGFERQELVQFFGCLLDTERNLPEELPYALQSIKRNAGYDLDEDMPHFRYTSIKDVPRKKRLEAVEAFVLSVRKEETTAHLIVVLDVVTDCVSSFNDDEQAMKLFDFLGNLCDRGNATFLLVIHQNPGTEKARGHAGTEAANKASTVMQIGFEKDANGNDSDLIKLRFLKLRGAKKPEPIFLQYSDSAKGLVLANGEAIANHINSRKQKGNVDDIAQTLEELLAEGPQPKNAVVEKLMKAHEASETTIRNRLREILSDPPAMYKDGMVVILHESREGQKQFYHLGPAVLETD